MIQVTVGNNLKRVKVVVAADTTIRTILEDNDIDYSVATVHMDGATLQPGDMDKTLVDFNITERCTLIAVIKADGAI